MKYYTIEEIRELQSNALMEAVARRKEESDFVIMEFRSYRCHACYALCSESVYFHDECAEKLIEGHSEECVRDSTWRSNQHVCKCKEDSSREISTK